MTTAHPHRISTFTATMLVIASMIGTGVLTTTGFLARDLSSPLEVLIIWAVGGILALSGALSYAELFSIFPKNGGEYMLLSRVYHPAVGFVAGVISLVVGFAAPVAATAIAFSEYLQAVIPALSIGWTSIAVILMITAIHAFSVSTGSKAHNAMTILKIALILLIIIAGLISMQPDQHQLLELTRITPSLISPKAAVGLILVSYAYTGWNSCAYIAGEMHRPKRELPRAIIFGTLGVTLSYILLTAVFLLVIPENELQGQIDIAHIAAKYIFGTRIADLISLGIALLLLSTMSAMTMTGPRIYQAMGQDYQSLHFFSKHTKAESPAAAVLLQGTIAIIIVIIAGFETILTYTGITLSIMAGLSVLAVIVLRIRQPKLKRVYRAWGYPFTPILFILLSIWMVVFIAVEKPAAVLASLATIAGSLLFYFFATAKQKLKDKK